MTSIAQNANNDIYLDANGNLAVVAGLTQCEQTCKTVMETVLGECTLNLQNGLPLEQTMWNRYLPGAYESAARKALTPVLNVVSVLSFTVTKSGDTANYVAVISTTFGKNLKLLGVIPNG